MRNDKHYLSILEQFAVVSKASVSFKNGFYVVKVQGICKEQKDKILNTSYKHKKVSYEVLKRIKYTINTL